MPSPNAAALRFRWRRSRIQAVLVLVLILATAGFEDEDEEFGQVTALLADTDGLEICATPGETEALRTSASPPRLGLPIDGMGRFHLTDRMRFTRILLCCLGFLVGCKHRDPSGASDVHRAQGSPKASGAKRTSPSMPPSMPAAKNARVIPVQELKGKVAAVNANLRFVVIDFFLSPMPQFGQRLSVFRQGLKVGEVKISGPERSSNVAADIVAGEAQVGDEVRVE
ncbi:MAG: hypothetical protein HY735_04710 [Verrucomicrobia bacterium]|nr:hypothetical protein [Verrucomicrobiota bacterium]